MATTCRGTTMWTESSVDSLCTVAVSATTIGLRPRSSVKSSASLRKLSVRITPASFSFLDMCSTLVNCKIYSSF